MCGYHWREVDGYHSNDDWEALKYRRNFFKNRLPSRLRRVHKMFICNDWCVPCGRSGILRGDDGTRILMDATTWMISFFVIRGNLCILY